MSVSTVLATTIKDANVVVAVLGTILSTVTYTTGLGFLPPSWAHPVALVILGVSLLKKVVSDVVADLQGVAPPPVK